MKSTQAASVSNHLRLSDGVSCVDYHRTFRALAIGSTRQLHIVEVVCAMAKDARVRQLVQPSPNNNTSSSSSGSCTAATAAATTTTAHSPFVLRNAGVFGGLQKVEHVAWYPSADEATLAFVQPGRSVTIFLDALLFRADGTYIPHQWTRARGKSGKVLHANMEAGGGPTATAVVGGLASATTRHGALGGSGGGGGGYGGSVGTPLTRTSTATTATPSCTPQFGVTSSRAGGGSSSSSHGYAGQLPSCHLPTAAAAAATMSSPLTATPTTAATTSTTATAASYVTRDVVATAATGVSNNNNNNSSSSGGAKEPIELVIPTAYLRVRKIAWDVHEPYTLALTSPTTHFELWRVPVDGARVYAPQLVLRPPAHDSRSVAVDVAFAPADRYCIVVMTETATAGQVLLYDRRHVEVPRRLDTAGSGLAAAFHPAFVDLLCVCYRKQKTRPECQLAFVRLADDAASVTQTTADDVAAITATTTATGTTTTTAVRDDDDAATEAAGNDYNDNNNNHTLHSMLLPPIDYYATVTRLRWRPPCGGAFAAASAQHAYLTFVPSLAGLSLPHAGASAAHTPSREQLDELLSQLWLGTLSTTTDVDIHVWDVTRAAFPIATVKFLCKDGKEPVDFVWLNELTMAVVLQGGEIVVTSVVNNTHVVDSSDNNDDDRQAASTQRNDNNEHNKDNNNNNNKDSASAAAVVTRARALYARDEMAEVMSLYGVLPNAVVVADWFGVSYVVRSSATAMKVHYTARVQRECVALLRRLLQHDDAERALQQQRRGRGGGVVVVKSGGDGVRTTTTTTTTAVVMAAVDERTTSPPHRVDATNATTMRETPPAHEATVAATAAATTTTMAVAGDDASTRSRSRLSSASHSRVGRRRVAMMPWARVFGRAATYNNNNNNNNSSGRSSSRSHVARDASMCTERHDTMTTTTMTRHDDNDDASLRAVTTTTLSSSPQQRQPLDTATRYGRRAEEQFAMAMDALRQRHDDNDDNDNNNNDSCGDSGGTTTTHDDDAPLAMAAAAMTTTRSSMAIAPYVAALLRRARDVQVGSSDDDDDNDNGDDGDTNNGRIVSSQAATDTTTRATSRIAAAVRCDSVPIECFALADAVCAGGAYVERRREQRRFLRYALQWDMGYEVALGVRRLRHCRDDALQRATRKQQQQQQQPADDDDDCATAVAEGEAADSGDDDSDDSAVADDGGGGDSEHAERVDDYFARMLLTNARICEDADEDDNSNDNNNDSNNDDNNDDTVTKTLSSDTKSRNGGTAAAMSTAGDCRALWWRAAAHAWRSHARDVIVAVTTSQLEYASLLGDVQYCLVLYILFCLWWQLRHTSSSMSPSWRHANGDDAASACTFGMPTTSTNTTTRQRPCRARYNGNARRRRVPHVAPACPLMPDHNNKQNNNDDAAVAAGACTAAQWKLRALQWLESYTSALYAHKLYVPLNELLLIMPEITQQPCNPVQPRAADIAYEKQMTYVYCATCPRSQLCAQPLPPPPPTAPLAVAAAMTHSHRRRHTSRRAAVAVAATTLSSALQQQQQQHDTATAAAVCLYDDSDTDGSSDNSSVSAYISSSSSSLCLSRDDACATHIDNTALAADATPTRVAAVATATAATTATAAQLPLCALTSTPLPHNASCTRCGNGTAMRCVVCGAVVEGMYYWLRTCGHGGHVQHMEQWLRQSDVCPLCGVPVSGAVATTTTTTTASAAVATAATTTTGSSTMLST